MRGRHFRVGSGLLVALGMWGVMGALASCSAAGDSETDSYPGTGGSDAAPDGMGGTGGTGGTGATGGSGGDAGQGGVGGEGGEAGDGGLPDGDDDASDGDPDADPDAQDGDADDGDADDGDTGPDGDGGCSSNPEICDGLDNNCDSEIDEGNPGGGENCDTGKLGVCQAGTSQCVSGSIKCVQNTLPDLELCDGLDNNCDGNTDEGDPGGGAQCNTGLPGQCQYGVMHCMLGMLQCQALNAPMSEVCNGLDDDCDGNIDNGSLPGVGVNCAVPNQNPNTPCGQSVRECQGGQLTCPQTYYPQSETCNGVDDDCNNTIDDPGSVNGLPCNTGIPGICSTGSSLCIVGSVTCNQTTLPQTEICDGLDNNCNGATDEMDPNTACANQYPAAQSVNAWGCSNGNCEISSCASDRFNVNTSVGDGCECSMSTLGNSCSGATAISIPLNTPLSSPITRTAGISSSTGSGWMRVNFAKPPIGTPYHFRITLTDSHGAEYRMNVRTTCSNYATCTAGATTETGADATTWEVSTSYGSSPADSPAPPSQVYVQIYRPTPQLTCETFEVSFYNY